MAEQEQLPRVVKIACDCAAIDWWILIVKHDTKMKVKAKKVHGERREGTGVAVVPGGLAMVVTDL